MDKIIAQFTLCFMFCFFLEALDNVVHTKGSKLYRITRLSFSALALAGFTYLMIKHHIF